METPITILHDQFPDLDLEPIHRAVETFAHLYKVGNNEITISIVRNDEVQRVNREFRKIDHPTDVLSFPAPENIEGQLGDILISLDFATIQALNRKVKAEDEVAMLAVHGCLHLIGFDDETEQDRVEMIHNMNRVMSIAGLPTDENWSSLPHEVSSK